MEVAECNDLFIRGGRDFVLQDDEILAWEGLVSSDNTTPRPVWPTVMVAGHRPKHLTPVAQTWVRAELNRLAGKLREGHGTTTAISGMTLGADLWWADAAVRAGLRVHAHLPYPQQAAKWKPEDQAEWWRLLGLATKTLTYGTGHDEGLLHARKRGMVHASAQTVAVWVYGKSGGTRTALEYAVGRGRRPIWVDPETRRTIWPDIEVWRRLLAPQPRRRAA